MTRPEWLELKDARLAGEDRRGWIKQHEFLHLTRDGNCLVIESLLHWLEARPDNALVNFTKISAEQLLHDRADGGQPEQRHCAGPWKSRPGAIVDLR